MWKATCLFRVIERKVHNDQNLRTIEKSDFHIVKCWGFGGMQTSRKLIFIPVFTAILVN